MSDLRDLYQEYILDHGKRPRNFHAVEGATHQADGFNPLCGDQIHLEVIVENGLVKDIGFTGAGCAISTASASTMTELVKGKPLDETRALFTNFLGLVKGETDADEALEDELAVFAGVGGYPMRVKCATLAWHTLTAALEGQNEVSTE